MCTGFSSEAMAALMGQDASSEQPGWQDGPSGHRWEGSADDAQNVGGYGLLQSSSQSEYERHALGRAGSLATATAATSQGLLQHRYSARLASLSGHRWAVALRLLDEMRHNHVQADITDYNS
ncbi:unnamed protein product, partial [Polarella glacialis]